MSIFRVTFTTTIELEADNRDDAVQDAIWKLEDAVMEVDHVEEYEEQGRKGK